jgi:site-specific DNA-cytosine methylase
MNVLSLFDGMSCGQIALKKLGAKVDNYYASEIDKYAIKVAKENFPNTVHLGDVTKITSVPYNVKIDLLIGGSPCQGFSKSGNRLNFDDPRSKLFFEFVRILKLTKPKYFLLENVVMNKESRDIISKYLGVEPIEINSNLVSAQSRRRLYWTNIPNVTVPEDKGIVIKDILEDNGIADLVINQGKHLYRADIKKSHCLMARDYKGFGNQSMTGVRRVGTANINGHDILKRVYDVNGKAPTLNTCGGGNREPKIPISEKHWRRLKPLECERLQTVPDNYTLGVSNTQRYKMLGNGWTVDVIAHIFKNITTKGETYETRQATQNISNVESRR